MRGLVIVLGLAVAGLGACTDGRCARRYDHCVDVAENVCGWDAGARDEDFAACVGPRREECAIELSSCEAYSP